MSANGQGVAILVAFFVSFHQTKHIFELGRAIDKSNAYMKFGRNRVVVGGPQYFKCHRSEFPNYD